MSLLSVEDFLETDSPFSANSATECIEAMVISFLTQLLHASANSPEDPDCISESLSSTEIPCPDEKKMHIPADYKPPPSAKPKIELLLVERKKGCLEDGYVCAYETSRDRKLKYLYSSLLYKKISFPKRRPTGSLRPFGIGYP